MFGQAVFSTLTQSGMWQRLLQAVSGGQTPCSVFGMAEGQKTYLAAALSALGDRPLLIVTPSEEATARFAADCEGLGEGRVMTFPARPTTLYRVDAVSRELSARRLAVLGAARSGTVQVVCATIDALMAPLPPVGLFDRTVLRLAQGQRLDIEAAARVLVSGGYERQERVEGVGQFSVRGGLMDIFPSDAQLPVRVEFFDDEIDTLRSFDPLTQRSVERLEAVTVYAATEAPLDDDCLERGAARIRGQAADGARRLRRMKREHIQVMSAGFEVHDATAPWTRITQAAAEMVERLATHGRFEGMENYLPCFYEHTDTLLDYLGDVLIVMDEPGRCAERCNNTLLEYASLFEEAFSQGGALPIQGDMLQDFTALLAGLERQPLVSLHTLTAQTEVTPRLVLRAEGRSMAGLRGQFDMLRGDLKRYKDLGYNVILSAGTASRAARLRETLAEYDLYLPALTEDRLLQRGEAAILPISVQQGFEAPGQKLAIYSERELFGSSRGRAARKKVSQARSLEAFTDLSVGDLVVHEVYGIGRFEGVERMESDGTTRDYLKLTYRGDDHLYVPTEQMDRVQKYIGGGENKQPTLSRLGGVEWKNTRSRVSRAIADMADDLIDLYSKRQAAQGFQFSQDTPWQREFEEAFPYEETPDQLQCIEDIKADMESPKVMDRLLCGDVGYGKTEVALRAVFKAAMDHKQVAFLAPTTILAHQHYANMLKRFEGFGVVVEELSRFRSSVEIHQTLSRLAQGKVDVVVGTHRLLSTDVLFHDLGLLVVDEEQRFGVAHKEKIKRLRAQVDVLTMTATPIPRTLHMSMVGIRDISVLNTPPEERYPVQTVVLEYDEGLVRDALLREIGRGGQAYFLYNRVESIDIMHRRLQDLLPSARIVVGHGQMPERQLEKVMMQFMAGEADVLLCTTIIENGLDIPKANTMIVYDADYFGLSQLYQLRGRVGRSNRLAYAYLTYRRDKVLTTDAEKRLLAIREFTEFGSGFRVAMRDLELRGAGNILGAQQSGHMAAVGYALYCKLIEEAVSKVTGAGHSQPLVDPVLDLKIDAFLPADYVRDAQDRLEVYRRISDVHDEDSRSDTLDELVDRFGEPPEPVLRLIEVARLRAQAMQAAIARIHQSGAVATLRFDMNAHIDPEKLLEVVGRWQGQVSLGNTTPPSLRLRLPQEEQTDMLQKLLQLTAEVDACAGNLTA